MTSQLQVLDIIVNKPFKEQIKQYGKRLCDEDPNYVSARPMKNCPTI